MSDKHHLQQQQKNLQEDSLLLELFEIMTWVCQAVVSPWLFGKQKYPCLKYIWSYSAPNIASSLKFSSLKNGWFKHSITETMYIKKLFVRIFGKLRWQQHYPHSHDRWSKFSTLWLCQFSELSLLGNWEYVWYSSGNFTFWDNYCLVWCSIFWVNWYTFLRKQGRWGSNSKFSLLTLDASRISETKSAENWCWNPDSLVSARWGNSSHCEECKVSPWRDVSRACDLRKREYWMAC